MPLTILLVDDHPVYRDGLRIVLEAESGFKVIGEAQDAASAYAAVQQQRPDLVILDVSLPDVSGISAARELVRQDPECRILMLSMYVAEDQVVEALVAGVRGYAVKDQPAAELLHAARTVGRGERYLAPRFSTAAVEDMLRRRSAGGSAGPLEGLSPREREIFRCLIRGSSNDEISTELGISRRTVETHRSRVLRKLRVHSVGELLRLAARHGLLEE